MTHIAILVPVIESELDWGSKVDDHMVCLSRDDAEKFVSEFNSENKEENTPSWYMYAQSSYIPYDITDEQYHRILNNEDNRMWFNLLKISK